MLRASRTVRAERGITLIGLLLWAIVVAFVALIIVRVLPTINEYSTILRAVQVIAKADAGNVAAVRAAFEKQKEVEYSISSIGGKDLQVTKENDKLVVRFAYDKEVELFSPVFLLIKYRGEGRSN
jgi:ABC-type tungstate transport system permease subunit